MPFNGGGGGSLPAHEHTNIANDGGPLDFNNTTVGSMNAGDLTYSDGAALQQLAIAAPNDQLRVSAGNIPEWFTPVAAAGVWTKLADVTLGAVGDLDSGVFAAYDFLRIFFSGNINTTGWSCGMKFNNTAISSGLYYDSIVSTVGGSPALVYTASAAGAFNWDFVGPGGSTDWQTASVTVSNNATQRKLATWNTVQSRGGAVPESNNGAGFYNNTATPITSVQMCSDNGTQSPTRQFGIGSQMIVLGLT